MEIILNLDYVLFIIFKVFFPFMCLASNEQLRSQVSPRVAFSCCYNKKMLSPLINLKKKTHIAREGNKNVIAGEGLK